MNTEFSTGGILNTLCHELYANSLRNTISVSSLIKKYRPETADELEALIAKHSCNGTVNDFGKNFYNNICRNRPEALHNPRVTQENCILFMRSLFLEKSLRGHLNEVKVKKFIQERRPNYKVEFADDNLDFKYNVDLIILNKEGRVVAGVQVKPESYKSQLGKETHQQNLEKIKAFERDYNVKHHTIYITLDGTIYFDK